MIATYSTTSERGILNSVYKNGIRNNRGKTTLSKMKSIIEKHNATCQNAICTVVKISIFTVALVLILL